MSARFNAALCLAALFFVACGGGEQQAAPPAAPAAPPPVAAPVAAAPVGPDGPESIAVSPPTGISTDHEIIEDGEKVWGARGCGGCHTFGSKLVGPDLVGVTQRRSLTWITRMVSEPEQMTKLDPVARDLFKSAMVQMPKQGVTAEELPKLLAFIKSKGG